MTEMTRADFDAETARFREVLSAGRSANQLALFDLLVERSRDQRAPKEVEIALELFGPQATLDGPGDSGVRVYVHRLRKRIDEHYAERTGPRLVIPKGEYRVVVEYVDPGVEPPAPVPGLSRILMLNPALSLGLLLIVMGALGFVGMTFWPDSGPRGEGADARQAVFGAGASLVDPIIVVGDSLLLAETDDQKQVDRMVLDPAIRTREDLGHFIKSHPEQFYHLYDFDLRYAPVGALEAAWVVQGELQGAGARGQVPMVAVSSLDDEGARRRDVVFVGRLSQLGALQASAFAGSRFELAGFDRLVERPSGKVHAARIFDADPQAAGADLGYVSVRGKPGGRRLIVVAGLGDRGTAAMADLLRDPLALSALSRAAGAARTFEAVYAIDFTPGRQVSRRLLGAWPLG